MPTYDGKTPTKEANLDYETSVLDTSKITNFSSVFYRCNYITSLNISHWDVSNAQTLYIMCYWCPNLTSINISNWNVSNVTNMSMMFYECKKLDNESIKSICNMCINAVNVTYKNLNPSNRYSPIIYTGKNIANIVDTEILNKLQLGGWVW